MLHGRFSAENFLTSSRTRRWNGSRRIWRSVFFISWLTSGPCTCRGSAATSSPLHSSHEWHACALGSELTPLLRHRRQTYFRRMFRASAARGEFCEFQAVSTGRSHLIRSYHKTDKRNPSGAVVVLLEPPSGWGGERRRRWWPHQELTSHHNFYRRRTWRRTLAHRLCMIAIKF